MEPVSTSVHHIFPSCQVSAQFRSGRLGITMYHQKDGWWMFKNGSNSWLFWGFELSLTHFPRGPQFVLTEVKVSWILWSWQRVFWSWVMRRLSVHYPCHPLSTSHEQKSLSLGSQFFGRLRAYLIGAHVAGLVIPWAAGNAWAIGGSHGSHWGNRRWELTYDILRWFAFENYTYFVTKSKHSASFPSFLSCIEFRFRRTAWCTPGTPKQQTEFIFSTCIAKYVSLVFAVVHCFSIFFSWIKVNEILARASLQTFRQNRHWENTSWCFQVMVELFSCGRS